MANDLSTPLTGRRQRLKNALGRPHLPIARILFGLIGVIVIGTVARLVLVDDPAGGRPSQEAGIVNTQAGNSVADTVASAPATITADPQQYPVDGSIVAVPGPAADAHSAPNALGIVPELSEETANGAIPRISGTGQTPFAAYHHPFEAASAGTGPRIALIVTGLGINEQGSLDAIAQLPDLVTLAFAPYGKALEKTVTVARGPRKPRNNRNAPSDFKV